MARVLKTREQLGQALIAIATRGQDRPLSGDECIDVRDAGRLLELPIEMILFCPICNTRHIDEGEFATKLHGAHACQGCGLVWRPCKENSVGVQFLSGFKNT